MSELFSETIVVGVGLLGGSLGLAAKRARVGGAIIGLGRNETKLRRAVELGAIDAYATTWRDALSLCRSRVDAPIQVVFGMPVEVNLRALEEFWRLRRDPLFADRRFVVSDVGSVKKDFADLAFELARNSDAADGARISFVPAHPIAGSDKSGVEHSFAELFDGKLTILTPWRTAQERADALACGDAAPFCLADLASDQIGYRGMTNKFALAERERARVGSSETTTDKISECKRGRCADAAARAREFWTRLGSCVVETSAEEHDQILARTSHLPNLVSALATSVVPLDEFLFAGTGFRDVSRLAGGSPEMWTEIFLTNRAATLEALERLEENVVRWKTFLREGDRESILTFLQETKKKRDALGS